MDKETRQQLDEHYVERELAETFAIVVAIYARFLDFPPNAGWDDERWYLRWEAQDARKRLMLLRRLARLPANELDESCEHWRIDHALDENEDCNK